MENYIELRQMTPKAEIINGQVRIHEHDESVEMFEFRLGEDVPHLPICDELVEKMHEFARVFEANKGITDKKARHDANTEARMKLWGFAAQVEDELNRATRVK